MFSIVLFGVSPSVFAGHCQLYPAKLGIPLDLANRLAHRGTNLFIGWVARFPMRFLPSFDDLGHLRLFNRYRKHTAPIKQCGAWVNVQPDEPQGFAFPG